MFAMQCLSNTNSKSTDHPHWSPQNHYDVNNKLQDFSVASQRHWTFRMNEYSPKSQFTFYFTELWRTVQMWHSLPLDPQTSWEKKFVSSEIEFFFFNSPPPGLQNPECICFPSHNHYYIPVSQINWLGILGDPMHKQMEDCVISLNVLNLWTSTPSSIRASRLLRLLSPG